MSGHWDTYQPPVFGRTSFPLQQPYLGPQFPTNVGGAEGRLVQTSGSTQPFALPAPEEIEEGEITAADFPRRANDATLHQEYAPHGFSLPGSGQVVTLPFRTGTLFTTSNSYTGNENMLSSVGFTSGGPSSRSSGFALYGGGQVVRGPALRNVDTRSLTASQVLFYFGVLTIQESHLQPRFEYHRGENGKWRAKLTLYRDSLDLPTLRDTQMGAKVDICRLALSLLKPRYANWNVPDEPSESLTAPEWNWSFLTEGESLKMLLLITCANSVPEYTKQNQMRLPLFMKYLHENGYRFEVTLSGISAFGVRKFYFTEHEAVDAAAHEGLYLLLTAGAIEANCSAESGSSPTPDDGDLFSKAPSKASSESQNGQAKKPPPKKPLSNPSVKKEAPNRGRRLFPFLHGTRKPPDRESRRSITTNPSIFDRIVRSIEPPQLINSPNFPRLPNPPRLPRANLIPLENPRVPLTEVFNEPEQLSKWNITPGELHGKIFQKQTHVEKVDGKICNPDRSATTHIFVQRCALPFA